MTRSPRASRTAVLVKRMSNFPKYCEGDVGRGKAFLYVALAGEKQKYWVINTMGRQE